MKIKLPKLVKNENSKIWNDKARRALYGERQAARHLKKQGYRVLKTRFWTPYGEIDIVAQKGNNLAFVEVKTRSSSKYGDPLTAITQQKFTRLQRATAIFLQQWPRLPKDYAIEYLGVGVRLYDSPHPIDMVRIFFD